jgi:hypothetical protein
MTKNAENITVENHLTLQRFSILSDREQASSTVKLTFGELAERHVEDTHRSATRAGFRGSRVLVIDR